MASQKQLEGSGITRKGDPNSQVPAPPLTMVARRRQRTHRPTITPHKACFANFYRCIKRRVGRSLKRAHCKRKLVIFRKQAAYKLPRTQGRFSGFKRVPGPLFRQIILVATDNTTMVSYINKEGGMRSGPLCALL